MRSDQPGYDVLIADAKPPPIHILCGGTSTKIPGNIIRLIFQEGVDKFSAQPRHVQVNGNCYECELHILIAELGERISQDCICGVV
jgi:hypothetical protein